LAWLRPGLKLARRLHVHALAQCDVVELGVGRFFFVQACRQEANDFIVTELVRPRDERAIARDLVMLDGLRQRRSFVSLRYSFVLFSRPCI
jgi:hypothetical protein